MGKKRSAFEAAMAIALTVGFAVASIANDLVAMACSYTSAFFTWTIAAMAAGYLVCRLVSSADEEPSAAEVPPAAEKPQPPAADPATEGLSKLAADVYGKLEEEDVEALGKLKSASLYVDGEPVWPLVLDMELLPDLNISRKELDRLTRAGVLRKLDTRAMVPLFRIEEGRPAPQGTRIQDGNVVLSLRKGELCVEPAKGQFGADLISEPIRSIDLGLYEYTPEGRAIAARTRAIDVPGIRQYITEAYSEKRVATWYWGEGSASS